MNPETDPEFPVHLVGREDSPKVTAMWIQMHTARFKRYVLPDITCTCLKRVRLDQSYRCRMCRIWLCDKCAMKHFGLHTDSEGVVKQRSLLSHFIQWLK